MILGDPATGIFHRDFGSSRVARRDRNRDPAAIGREANRVIDQIADRAPEENRVGLNFAFAADRRSEPAFLRDRFIVGGDFSDRGPAVEGASCTLLSAASARARKSRLSIIPESRAHSAMLDSMTA